MAVMKGMVTAIIRTSTKEIKAHNALNRDKQRYVQKLL